MKKNVEKFIEANELIKLQMLEQLPTPVLAVDKELRIIYINNAGKKVVNSNDKNILGEQCCNILNSPYCNTDECNMKLAIKSGKMCSGRNEILVNEVKTPVEYFCVPLKNEDGEIIGGLEFIIDITDRVKYEERIREQSETIREMSTPTIELWDGVLVLPVVGVVDSMRAQHMMESMLNKIMETYSKVIIMDISGVAAVDTAVANHLIKITKATKLMGCECIISGISPAVAQTIIQLGVEMENIKTKSTLGDALAEAFSMLQLEVKSKKDV